MPEGMEVSSGDSLPSGEQGGERRPRDRGYTEQRDPKHHKGEKDKDKDKEDEAVAEKAEKDKGRPQTRKGGRKKKEESEQTSRGTKGGSKGVPTAVKDLLPTIRLIIKGLLKTMQGQRDVEACLFDCLTGDSGNEVFVRMKEQTTSYSKLEQEEKNKKGSPHLMAYIGLLKGIVAQADHIGKKNKEILEQHSEEVRMMSIEVMGEQVRMCRQMKCYSDQHKKLILEISHVAPEARQAILSSLQQLGFQLKQGRAPAGHIERELSDILEQALG